MLFSVVHFPSFFFSETIPHTNGGNVNSHYFSNPSYHTLTQCSSPPHVTNMERLTLAKVKQKNMETSLSVFNLFYFVPSSLLFGLFLLFLIVAWKFSSFPPVSVLFYSASFFEIGENQSSVCEPEKYGAWKTKCCHGLHGNTASRLETRWLPQ